MTKFILVHVLHENLKYIILLNVLKWMYTISFTLLIFVKLYIPKNIAKQTIGYTMQRFCCKNGVHVPVCLFIYNQFHSRG